LAFKWGYGWSLASNDSLFDLVVKRFFRKKSGMSENFPNDHAEADMTLRKRERKRKKKEKGKKEKRKEKKRKEKKRKEKKRDL
jgi:hypothetical protein